ncbi:MAG: 3-dehydroquinate dehydratase, partial [Bacillota bacterium]|nr:3-dehydroquinate dehydratase [Bacillota bacterium]
GLGAEGYKLAVRYLLSQQGGESR